MGYNTALTEWPSVSTPETVKQLVDKFFATMDTKAPSAGDILANEIFAVDGVIDGRHPAIGREAIRKSRDSAWDVITSRRHEILKVYIDSDDASDLLVIGQVTVSIDNGGKKKGEFIARIRVAGSQTADPRIALYKTWLDASAMKDIDAEN